MKKVKLFILGLFIIILVSNIIYPDAGQPKQDEQEMMEVYMKMMALNENHDFLKNFVGEWDVTTTAWMQPGADPAESKNSAAAELILGGRFLKIAIKGMMFGQPFEGLQIVGFDNYKNKINTFWIDSTSTAFYLTEGTLDQEKNTIFESANWLDPMTGGTIQVRTVTTLVSENEYVYQMFMPGPDGNEFKSVENIAIRKK